MLVNRPLGNRVDTPDTFPISSGGVGSAGHYDLQAFLWLTGGKTVWMVGTFDSDTGIFTAPKSEEGQSRAAGTGATTVNPAVEKYGIVDPGFFVCQQSMTDVDDRRVQFGWIGAGGPGWSGVQSLPREIQYSSRTSGLTFNAHPNVWTLHGDDHSTVADVVLQAGDAHDLTPMVNALDQNGVGSGNGTRLHLRVTIFFPTPAAGGGGGANVAASVHISGGEANGGSTIRTTTVFAPPRNNVAGKPSASSPAGHMFEHDNQSKRGQRWKTHW